MMCASALIGNGIVLRCYDHAERKLGQRAAAEPGKDDPEQNKSRINGMIGTLERMLYVYAVFRNQYSIISGWLVLKAFFGWMQRAEGLSGQSCKAAEPAPQDGGAGDASTRLHQGVYLKYCMYIYGNGLSLAVGLACGEAALLLSEFVGRLLA